MPGICGILSDSRDLDLGAMLTRMTACQLHYPWYVVQRHLDADSGLGMSRVTLGFVNPAAQPVANEDGSLLALMDGELYDYDEQRKSLTAAGRWFTTDSHAEVMLHGFEQEGRNFFRRLNGSFVAALWDTKNRRLVLLTDRIGMKPLYYAALPGRFLFATEIKSLLADGGLSRTCNPRGLAQFFSFGQLLGTDTLYEAVRLLPAAGWLTYDATDGRLHVERYWRLESNGKPFTNGTDRVLERLDEAFQRAVERRTWGTERLGLSLSGGLDSRTILAVMKHDQTPITTVSMGVKGSVDHHSAQRMAELVNSRHYSCYLTTDLLNRFEEHMRYMVHLTDGQYLCQCIIMPTLPVYRRLGIEVLLRGHAGELLHMRKAYNFSLSRDALTIADEAGLERWLFHHLRAYMLEAVDGPIFTPAYQGQLETLARESLLASLRETATVEPPLHRIWYLFLNERSRRETALSMVEFGSLVETRLPYLDNDLIDLLFAVPPELKLADVIQTHILRRHFPAFLDVVNANTGAKVGAGAATTFLTKARMKVFAKLRVPGYQPYERLGLWLRRELRPLVHKILLDDRTLQRGFFQPDSVRTIIEQHQKKERNHTYLLLALMIFELGQREFVDGEAYDPRDYHQSVV